jgi:hypothetical protein
MRRGLGVHNFPYIAHGTSSAGTHNQSLQDRRTVGRNRVLPYCAE